MTTDIRLYFDCNSKKTYIKDFTDYNTSEFPYNVQIDSAATLFDPTNNLIINLVDFTIDKSIIPNVTPEYNLNVTTSNAIIPGNYKLNYTNGYTFNQSGEDLNMSFISPSIIAIPLTNLSLIWAAGDTFSIYSATDSENNGTYTISDIMYYSNTSTTYITVTTDTFVVPENPGPDATAQIIFTWKYIPIYTDKIYTYTSCSSVTPCITANYDCTSTPFGNITFEDSSVYPTGFVADDKEFTIYYPNGLDFTQSPNPDNYPIENPLVVENGSFVTINTLATGTWSAKLALTTSKTQVDGLVIINVASVVKEFNVSCTSNMCGLSSCLTKLKDRHISYLRSSSVSPLQQYVDNVQLLYTMAREAQACGDKNAYERYIAEIFEVVKQTDTSCGCGCSGSCSGSCDCGDCSSDCGCGETGPTWVNNVGININSLLEELAGIPAQVDALQTNVDGLADDVSALNNWTGLGETLPGGQTLFNTVDGLVSTTTNLGSQVNNNTGDITGLQVQVDTLESEVAALQEQIDQFSPSDSEISTYELMTNDGSKQSAWDATSGTALSSVSYGILISGDVTEYILTNDYLSFYNPTTSSWFYGQVSSTSYSGGSTSISVAFNNTVTYPGGASWQDSSISFPVYKGDLTSGEYNFTNTLKLENDSYWKFSDVDYKYWSKIKASFVVNEPYYEGTIQPILVNNSTANKSIILRAIPCGSFVDLELSFEKQWNGAAYDTVTLVDVKYNTSSNIALSEDSELLFGGYKGFNPKFSYGVDLYDGSYEFSLAMDENIVSTASVQDIVNSEGVDNTNRKISRYAKGPSYPNNSAANFFTGSQIENIVFNSTNMNITLLNIEQSFGKMPVILP
jgi:uncharacterized protein YoxC